MTKYNSRKLYATLILYLTATVALYLDKSTFNEWSTFMVFITGLYFGANVLDKKVQGDRNAKENIK